MNINLRVCVTSGSAALSSPASGADTVISNGLVYIPIEGVDCIE
jgi:hypothetical protein